MSKSKLSLIPILLLITTLAFAQDGPRYALVIGNSDYTGLSSLQNPVNDATDMEAALRRLGFTVDLLTNADLSEMEAAAMRLSNRLSEDENSVGLFFYAGHGVQSEGVNYLIPSRTAIGNEAFLKTRALSGQAVLDLMQRSGNSLNLVFLDACRDNPFGWARSGTRGLSVVSYQPPGSIVVYATGAGSVAQDGDGRNGVFTGELLRNLEVPGLELNQILDQTASGVQSVTGGEQVPAVYKQYFGRFVMKPGESQNTNSQPTFGEVTVSQGDLLITLDAAGTVTLLGQSLEIPAGGSLPVKNLAVGSLDIQVRYENGHTESRNVYIRQGVETQVRFSSGASVQPPTDIYVYGLYETSVFLDNETDVYLDEASGANNYLLRNELSVGKHALWWLNDTSLYAYIFELKSGVNRISPSFTRYRLPRYETKFEFQEYEVETNSREFEFTLFDENWEASTHTASINTNITRQITPDADLRKETGGATFTGMVSITHPGGITSIPIDLTRDFSQNFIRTDLEEIYRDENYSIDYRLYASRDFIQVEVGFFHIRPWER